MTKVSNKCPKKMSIVCNLAEESITVEESIDDTTSKDSDSGEQSRLHRRVKQGESFQSVSARGESSEVVAIDKKMPDNHDDENMSVDDNDCTDKMIHQTSDLPSDPRKPVKADVHKLVAAHLEKEDKELENLNKNLISIIGNFMAKVQGVSSNTSALNSSSSQETQKTTDPIDESLPRPIEVVDFSSTCPTESYDYYHHLDPQDRSHCSGVVPEPQFVEYVMPSDTPSEIVSDASIAGSAPIPYVQHSQQYYSQMSGPSHYTPYEQQVSDTHRTAPINLFPGQETDPYSAQGTDPVNLYYGQEAIPVNQYSGQGTVPVTNLELGTTGRPSPSIFNVPPSGYSAMVNADHSPDHYSDSEPHVGPCTPEESNVETFKKPFMTDEEIRLHRKQYFKNKREQEIKSLMEKTDLASQSSCNVSQPKTKAQGNNPEHSRKDQKPSFSKQNHPKGQSKFMIPQRRNESREGKESKVNPANPFSPFSPNPSFFAKKKSSVSSNPRIKSKPDSNKLDRHFYNELKSIVPNKPKSHSSPICDNSISSTTDGVTSKKKEKKKKKLDLKHEETKIEKKYSKNVIESGKQEKKKETSLASSTRKIISSDEEDTIETKSSNQESDRKQLSMKISGTEDSKSSVSQSISSHSKDLTNTTEQYPFVVDDLSRKAIAYKCFVKLVNIFWQEKRAMTVEEMDEKLPKLVRKKLDLLNEFEKSEAVQEPVSIESKNEKDSTSDNQESSVEKSNEIIVENEQVNKSNNIEEEIDDKDEAKGMPVNKCNDIKDEIDIREKIDDKDEAKDMPVNKCNVIKEEIDGKDKDRDTPLHKDTDVVQKQENTSVEDGEKMTPITGNIPEETEQISIDTREKQGITLEEKSETSLEDKPKSTPIEILQCPSKEDSCPVLERSNTLGNPQNEIVKVIDATDFNSGSKSLKQDSSISSAGITLKNDDFKHSSIEKKEESAKKPHEKCSKGSLTDSQHQKKRSKKDSLKSAVKKKRKISSGSSFDLNSDHKEIFSGKSLDKIGTSTDNETSNFDEESTGYTAEDHSMDHDDREDEQKKSDKVEHNENLNESSKTKEKIIEIEGENLVVDHINSANEIIEKQESCEEDKISENNKDEGNNKEIQLLECSVDAITEDNKEAPQLIKKPGYIEYPSTSIDNKLVSQKNIITSLERKCLMNCTVKLIDMFWKEKKSISHEKLQEILPTLINKIMEKYKISNKAQKPHKKHKGLQEESSGTKVVTLVTKAQKKFFKTEDKKAEYKKFNDEKKKAGKESSKNLKKKSGISCEFIPTSSSDDDEGPMMKHSEKSNMCSISGTNKTPQKVRDQLAEHEIKREKKKKKKKSREKRLSSEKIILESEKETSTSEKTEKSDNPMNNPLVASESKKRSKQKRKEHKMKKKEKKMKKDKKEKEFSKTKEVPLSNASTDVEEEDETSKKNTKNYDGIKQSPHVVSTSEEKSTLESRDNIDKKQEQKRPNLSASSHLQSEYSKEKKKKSDKFLKKQIIFSSTSSSDNEEDSFDKQNAAKNISLTVPTAESQNINKNIVEHFFSVEERTQIFSDSEEECAKDKEPPSYLSKISSENQNSGSIKDTVSNIIDSLSVDRPVKEEELQSKSISTCSSLHVDANIIPEVPIHLAKVDISCVAKTSELKDPSPITQDPQLPSSSSAKDESALAAESCDPTSVTKDPVMPSSSCVEIENVPEVSSNLAEVHKISIAVESSDRAIIVNEDSQIPSSSSVENERVSGEPSSVTQYPLLPSFNSAKDESSSGVKTDLQCQSDHLHPVSEDSLIPSSCSVKDESTPKVQTHLEEVNKLSYINESDKPCSISEDSPMPSSSNVGNDSAPGDSTDLTKVNKLSLIAESDEQSSISEDHQLPSLSNVGNDSATGDSTNLTKVDKLSHLAETGDSSSATQISLSTSLSSVDDTSVPKVPSHLEEVGELSHSAGSGDQSSVSPNDLLPSLVENVQTESNTPSQLIVDEKCLAVSPLQVPETEKRRAPEGMQKDLAELDKKMEEIEKIVHNQLESTSVQLPSTSSNKADKVETNLSNSFKCIICKKTFCTDPGISGINDNYSEKVSAFCKLCFENLYKERFDYWCKSMETKYGNKLL